MADITYVTIPELTAAQDSQVTDSALIEVAVVDANGTNGYSSKKVTKEQLLASVKDDLGDLSELDTTAKSSLVAAINEVAQGGGGALTQDTKQALLQCFAHTAWTDDQGQDYYDDLEDALYPFELLSSITAVYTQSGTVYDTDSLDSLKADLVVTGNYSDGTYNQTTKYTLSGTLTVGTSTITVTYGGKTTTFTVTVTQSTAVLTSISAVYTQSGTVYDTDSLDSLKTDLVVTAHYSDSTTETVASSDYTLSGTLTVGTSTVTVTYSGKTTTFTVTVSSAPSFPYVTNGLTHMWDGIDNTLNGHDSSTDTWYDLVGSLHLSKNNAPTWDIDAAVFTVDTTDKYYIGNSGLLDGSDSTFEVVFEAANSQTAGLAHVFSHASVAGKAVIYSDNTFNVKGQSAKTYPSGQSAITGLYHIAGTFNSFSGITAAYANGVAQQIGNTTHSLSGTKNNI